MKTLEPCLDLTYQVLSLCQRAGVLILEIYESDFEVSNKADNTPLTTADMAAHELISSGLMRLTPEVPVLSEEANPISYEERARWACYWLVDPLDGTREFIKRNGEFSVNVALVRDGEPVLGVVYAPVLARGYYACRGQGAWRVDGAHAPRQIRVRTAPDGPVTIAGSRSRGDRLTAYLRRLGNHNLIAMGSALKSCLVAEGSADLYPRLGPTSEWDTAAAQCVVEEAGGHVTDTNMARLRYNTKASLRNPDFFVYGDKRRDWSAYL